MSSSGLCSAWMVWSEALSKNSIYTLTHILFNHDDDDDDDEEEEANDDDDDEDS